MGNDRAEVTALKHTLRTQLRSKRAAMSEQQRAAAAIGLNAQLRDVFGTLPIRSFSCFMPTATEPNIRGFLRWATTEGIDMLFPAARADGLLDWIRPNGTGTVIGAFGVEEPLGDRLEPLAVNEIDLMLIPAAAVDESGIRLGWGRGYFDRALASMTHAPPAFAIIYDHELIASVPRASHDVPVTAAVTPLRIVRF